MILYQHPSTIADFHQRNTWQRCITHWKNAGNRCKSPFSVIHFIHPHRNYMKGHGFFTIKCIVFIEVIFLRRATVSCLLLCLLLILLLFNVDAARCGAADGLQLCTQVIIPTLFPFFFISCWLSSHISALPTTALDRILPVPQGCGSILLLGFLGGYPVGATAVTDAWKHKKISRKTANILLGYCNNAGPAFIFGISHILFSSFFIPWLVWIIQILSAVITGYLFPKPEAAQITKTDAKPLSPADALRKSISVTASVCGWILLFKIILNFMNNLSLPAPVIFILSIFSELSNGCLMLTGIASPALRFTVFTSLLSCGGFCVYMQTLSSTDTLGLGLYFPGKIAQTAISFLLSTAASRIVFSALPFRLSFLPVSSAVCIGLILLSRRKARNYCGNKDGYDV